MKILDYCYGFPRHAFDAGDIILGEGSQTGHLYILLDGTVEIDKQGLVLNKVSEAGAIFGEVSSLLDTPHMATVKALTPCRLYFIEDAREFIRTHPEVGVLLATVLAQRLSSVTTHLANVTKSLNTLMKRETAPKKVKEQRQLEKPVVQVLKVGALHRSSITV